MEYNLCRLSEFFGDGRKIIIKNETASTNTDLECAVKSGECAVGDIISAKCQSGGRGRHGKSFASPPGGIYFSFCVGDVGYGLSTVICGVAVAKALEKFGFSPKIKWVNDIYLGEKKVCGILAKAIGDGCRAVMGVGINAEIRSVPENLRGIATALDEHSDGEVDACALIYEIVSEYERLSAQNAENGSSGIIAEYEKRMMLIGRKITVVGEGEALSVIGVEQDGALCVRRESGEVLSLSSGEISVVPIM